MSDPNDLLTTLSQSSAVMVAIIGGFLVSRLVTLSSEREGIRRQLREATERLDLFKADYGPAYEHRLEWSQRYFRDMVLDTLVENPDADVDRLVLDNVPRGSSVEEITPYAQQLKARVEKVRDQIVSHLHHGDDRSVDLDDLQGRGLHIRDEDRDIYESIMYLVRSNLPSRGLHDSWIVPPIMTSGSNEIEARRFDEALRTEVDLAGQIKFTERELERLRGELGRIARPVGVVSATWMLAILSVTGIVVPVVVMAAEPTTLSAAAKISLIAGFVIGLGALLLYIVWYLRHLDAASEDASAKRVQHRR